MQKYWIIINLEWDISSGENYIFQTIIEILY